MYPAGEAAATKRGPRAAEEIFQATLRLLAERGYPGLTIEGVAESARVNKTTIYRWWPSKASLLRDAVLHAKILEFEIPDTGSLREDLISVVTSVVNLLTNPELGPVIRGVLRAAAAEPELADLSRELLADRMRRETPLFTRAVARGELAPETDPMLLADLIGGATWFRLFFRQLPVSADFPRRVVDAALAGIEYRYKLAPAENGYRVTRVDS